jgi:ribosomal protein S18 acetylase RimI-like enzyme
LNERRLQAFLRATAAQGREVERVAAFELYLDPDDGMKYLNYAIPDDGAEPDAAAVEALRAAFQARERLTRLEWIEEAAPAVAAALARAGMEQELRMPLMTCTPEQLVAALPDVDGVVIKPVDDGNQRTAIDMQRVAFGQPPLRDDEPVRVRGAGATVLAEVGDEPVAAAVWTGVIGGVTEVGGVATAEPWRRRGLAGAVTAAAAREAFEAGAELCVLSPGDETAQRVYERAGFRAAAMMLHWSDDAS